MADYLTLRIDSPEKLIWEGKVRSVSSVNSAGPFDILPLHANFITIVEKQPIKVVSQDGEKIEYNFELSVILTRSNSVSIYTNV